MKLKFCGLTRKADIEAANETKPDFIGFVFAESRRHVSDMDAARLKEHLDPEIKAVGVFVNDEPEHIAALVRDEVIDIIQLHGGESLHYINKLRKLTSAPIVYAVRAALWTLLSFSPPARKYGWFTSPISDQSNVLPLPP